jgi:predicted phosphoadenosine phosphosulfate sulfurtransferase
MEIYDVLTAARVRVAYVFDRFDRIVLSTSGGKDSECLFWLAVEEATKRNRTVDLFFLDQEAEYQSTIDVIDRQMRHPAARPFWYQVPIRMTNATSHTDSWLYAWGEGQPWIRERSPIAITSAPGAPDRFYDFFPWDESQHENTAFLVGLRSRESMNRWRAMAKNPGIDGIPWSTKAAGNGNFRLYPLFDWDTGDVWKYIADNNIPYNTAYDKMYAMGIPARNLRVSNLIHEQAFRALALLHELEPETYARLLARLGGVHAAALYSREDLVFSSERRPDAFATWLDFRDYLLATTPGDVAAKLRKRLAKQPSDEATCKEQVRQILTNDWENNVPVRREKASKLHEQWWDRL